MALYLGSEKVKINLDGVEYYLNLYSEIPITNGIRLVTSDGYVLRDSNMLYLTIISTIYLLDSDNYILTDSNGTYLTIKENE